MAGFLPDVASESVGERTAPPDAASPMPKMGAVVIEIRPGVRVTVTDQDSAEDDNAAPKDPSFDDNLAETIDTGTLSVIASDLLEGIDSDVRSREGFVANYIKGLDLLGLKIESASVARGRRSSAKVWHPLLLWSIIEFQSGARAELYPASGPCKVSIAGDEDAGEQKRAKDLQDDLNYYLTTCAPEYYPDSDQALFYLGYGGNVYKKVYRCPVRQRPVSESVFIPDLIVSQDATDTQTAQRVTQKMEKLTREVKQLQRLGLYRDIELSMPSPQEDRIKQKEREIAGRKAITDRPADMPHTIYECYTFLDLSEWGHKEDGQTPGIPLPYRVTLDKDSRTILEIRRNWREDDELFRRRRVFVKFGLVPGMGFLDYGLLHLLGNSTRALTALWRISIDAGMFSNFPGGVRTKGARADTNELNPGPGEFVPVDVSGDDIRKAIMAMPYKDVSPALISLMQYIEKNAQSLWGALKFQVGEGRTNIPVGTMMAMVEQQIATMAAVHKRLHAAQAEELELLKELFSENPQDLWRFSKNPARKWEKYEEFADLKLIPASDPNVPAQSHRIMQGAALATLAQNNPQDYNSQAVQRRLLMNLGISDADSLLNPNAGQQQPPDPKAMADLAKVQVQKDQVQGEIQKAVIQTQGRQAEIAAENENRAADRQAKIIEAGMRAQSAHQQSQASLFGDLMDTQHSHHADIVGHTLKHAADVFSTKAGMIPEENSSDES